MNRGDSQRTRGDFVACAAEQLHVRRQCGGAQRRSRRTASYGIQLEVAMAGVKLGQVDFVGPMCVTDPKVVLLQWCATG